MLYMQLRLTFYKIVLKQNCLFQLQHIQQQFYLKMFDYEMEIQRNNLLNEFNDYLLRIMYLI